MERLVPIEDWVGDLMLVQEIYLRKELGFLVPATTPIQIIDDAGLTVTVWLSMN